MVRKLYILSLSHNMGSCDNHHGLLCPVNIPLALTLGKGLCERVVLQAQKKKA